ncbi:Hypothetical protein NTJ_01446 [Nesidiocoris tenuis]|uniref:Uncharacterized protein n=1 Tax=Nesidiocoris tenuis TaxID=355587 RepID=A0ABN7A8W9_9HEMI|nr:Hypothetical protein NTJ_01446 [Nesidiocoris tenuis]
MEWTTRRKAHPERFVAQLAWHTPIRCSYCQMRSKTVTAFREQWNYEDEISPSSPIISIVSAASPRGQKSSSNCDEEEIANRGEDVYVADTIQNLGPLQAICHLLVKNCLPRGARYFWYNTLFLE